MADHINGPLHIEQMGVTNEPLMVFVHPNPMDNACWIFQMAHFSTWYHCVAVDLPGYGRSPTASDDVTLRDVAQACWEAVDQTGKGSAVLVGCSVGSHVVQHMYHLRPSQTQAVVLSGTGYSESKDFVYGRIREYQQNGLDYRWSYTLDDFSTAFRESPLAEWFAKMFTERNEYADLDTIIALFRALGAPDDESLHTDLNVPVLILTGSEDKVHARAHLFLDRFPDAELVTLEGAGHACNIEQPWEFDSQMIAFLERRKLFPQ